MTSHVSVAWKELQHFSTILESLNMCIVHWQSSKLFFGTCEYSHSSVIWQNWVRFKI